MKAKVLRELMKSNDDCARRVRAFRHEHALTMINLIGGPGCGKTTLLEATIRRLAGRVSIGVIEGDLATARDAERVAAAGANAIQINTNRGCHLEAHQILRALEEMDPRHGDLIVVENVGNLICPAEFDLGEDEKVAMVSVAEGDDKPLKYPHLFRLAHAVVLSKCDLERHVRFDRKRFFDDLRQINGALTVFETSVASDWEMDGWLAWIERFACNRATQDAAV